ncbi:MerR family transcriptional regulator [Nostoc sp. TCL26-01]|uniref:MerR family transcriptional regulator n=1 Tax=Nostoc sp. TCL26-01 TaxID=2576904 RepID=UPI0015BF3987|nr:MerR family transcriptional regulator [Nostoc sp. TCL26-01]QLE58411.1 MerR family transcriptional regulator [Nostoc sp. TCL26-01]
MFKIGDFSRLGQVSVRMLRHYDDLGLLKPAHVDQFTDYRYYTIEQLPRLNRILALKDLGLPLEQIADLLRKDLPSAQLQHLLQSKQKELHQQLQDTQGRLNRLSARLRQLEQEGQPSAYDVIIKSVPGCCIASAHQIVPTAAEMPKYRGMLIRQLYAWLKEQNIVPIGCEIVLYHISEYTETNIDMEFTIAIPEPIQPTWDTGQTGITVRQLPAIAQVASVVHSGMIRNITQAIIALFTWIGTNGYTTSGAIREIHLFGAETLRVRDQPVVVELQVPIEPFESN